MLLTINVISLFETQSMQWIFGQHSGYWWPGALEHTHALPAVCWFFLWKYENIFASCIIDPEPMKQPWRIWVKKSNQSIRKSWYNQKKKNIAQKPACIFFTTYCNSSCSIFPFGWISATCSFSMHRNDKRYKHIFMFLQDNFTHKKLTLCG